VKSTPIRNPDQDIMLAPGSAALILIDYQPPQVSTVESMDSFMPDGAVQSEPLVGKY
jgi:hypothetical protein